MGQIPQTKRLVTEDFDGQQEWIGKLIDPLNSFMQETVQLVNQSLTFSENFNGAILSFITPPLLQLSAYKDYSPKLISLALLLA